MLGQRHRSEIFRFVFEDFIFQEIKAHSHYSGLNYNISTWRTASQLEVDFILGDHEVALEIKGSERVHNHDLRGLKAFQEEYKVRHAIVVSLENRSRQVDGGTILPWRDFLKKLWNGDLI